VHINRKDVLWNYAATFLQIGAQALLLPFILRTLPQETIGIWTIFSTIIALVNLLDFGFNSSFTRNVAYVFSGAKILKATGFDIVEENTEIDYGLLKNLITAMRMFYFRMAAIFLVVLASIGTYYIYTVLKTYTGSHTEVYIAWTILCGINTYSFYSRYYDSLLQGKGLIKRSKQIDIIGQSMYLLAAIVLITVDLGLIAIVSAQALSIIIRRILSHLTFYTAEITHKLQIICKQSQKKIFRAIYPNAVKVGLTSIGGFLVNRSAIIVGSLYLPLDTIASYGITVQLVGIIAGISRVYFSTYQPKIMQYRIQDNLSAIKRIYLQSCLILLFAFIFCGSILVVFGDLVLNLIGSKTCLLHKSYIIVMLLIALLESNHGNAATLLLTKNEVPFFKAGIISGSITLLMLFILLGYVNWGIWGMILSPGIVQGCYQNWKWPKTAMKELAAEET
jgi:O-antigen/teichoic acid export membrane protein